MLQGSLIWLFIMFATSDLSGTLFDLIEIFPSVCYHRGTLVEANYPFWIRFGDETDLRQVPCCLLDFRKKRIKLWAMITVVPTCTGDAISIVAISFVTIMFVLFYFCSFLVRLFVALLQKRVSMTFNTTTYTKISFLPGMHTKTV